MNLTFALDFDDTLTADPVLWLDFVVRARSLGHKVMIVTCRMDTEENRDVVGSFLDDWGIGRLETPVVYTNLGSKLHAVQERGLKIDIWIDDDPACILHGK